MPIKVIDTASQQEVEVSAAEAQAMLDAGQAILPAAKVKVIREGNRTGTVDTANLDAARAEGWRLADDDEHAQAKLRREESDVASTLQGGFEAAVRGVTFGASDYLAREADVDMERMRARQQALGGLGTALELGAGLATGSAIAKGVTKVGGAAVRLAAPEVAQATGLVRAPSLARTVVHTGAQGAVEGWAAGAGKEVSEASLGEREILAERVLAAGGYGGIFGGFAGTLIPGMTAAGAGLARVGGKSVKRVLGGATGASEDGSTLISRIIGSDAETRAARAKIWAPLAGVDDDVATRLAGDVVDRPDALTRAMDEAPRVGEEIADSLRDPITSLRAARDRVRAEFGGAQKIRHVERNLPRDTDRLLQATDAGAAKLDELDGALSSAGPLTNASDIRTIRLMIAEAKTKIGAAASTASGRSGQRVVAAVTHRAIDEVKQGVFQLKSNWSRIARSASPTREAQEMIALLDGPIGRPEQGLYGRLRSHLEDEAVWGDAGKIQQEINGASAAALDARRLLKGSAGGRLLDTRTPVVDNADLLTVARQFGRFQGATKTELLEDAIAAERRYIDAASRNLELGPEAKAAIAAYREAADGFTSAVAKKRELVRMLDDVEHFRSREGGRSVSIGLGSNLSTFVGSSLGGAIGGLPGAAIGAVAAAAFRPYTLVRKLAAIQARSTGATLAQAKAIGDFIGRIASGSLRQVERASRVAGRAVGMAAAKESARTDDLDKVRKTTGKLVSDPAYLAEQVGRMTADMHDVAPELAVAIGAKTRTAVAYLAAKAPPAYQAPWSSAKPLVDPVALATYERCVEGTLRPFQALARLSSGTFTKEHVEAIQAVHPAIYRAAQAQILEAMATAKAKGKSLSLEDATQISIFFGVQADPTLASAVPISNSMTPPAQEQGGPTNQPAPSGRKPEPIDTTRYATEVQQIGNIT